MANQYWWNNDKLVFADGKYVFCDECPCTGTGTTGTGTTGTGTTGTGTTGTGTATGTIGTVIDENCSGYCRDGILSESIAVSVPPMQNTDGGYCVCDDCENFEGTYIANKALGCAWSHGGDNPTTCNNPDLEWNYLTVRIDLVTEQEESGTGSDIKTIYVQYVRVRLSIGGSGECVTIGTWKRAIDGPLDCVTFFDDFEVYPTGNNFVNCYAPICCDYPPTQSVFLTSV